MILYGMRGMQKERDLERQQFFTMPESDVKSAASPKQEEDQEIIADLTDRMSEMEKSLFEHLLKWQMEKEELLGKVRTEKASFVEVKPRIQDEKIEKDNIVKENTEKIEAKEKKSEKAVIEENIEIVEKDESSSLESKKKPMPDNIRKVMDYEKEGLSIQEIANITRMNKGEVLLLRNLSKHYRK